MTNYLEQYFTPPEVTSALLARLALHGMTISEPCAGDGWIVRELREAGCKVKATDVDPKYTATGMSIDFFSRRASTVHQGAGAIITNPPWSDAARFVRRALEFTPNVAMLLRLTFLEPCESTDDSRRVDLLQNLTAWRSPGTCARRTATRWTSAWMIRKECWRWGNERFDEK